MVYSKDKFISQWQDAVMSLQSTRSNINSNPALSVMIPVLNLPQGWKSIQQSFHALFERVQRDEKKLVSLKETQETLAATNHLLHIYSEEYIPGTSLFDFDHA